MAEVIDIIHKLSYEVEGDTLQQVNKEFGDQLKEMQLLQTKVAELEKQLASFAQHEVQNRQKITQEVQKNKKAYDDVAISVGKQAAANEKLTQSIAKTGKGLQNLSSAGTQILREAPAFAFSVQTGLLAVSNNIPILIDQLQAAKRAGESTTSIFKALGSSIFGISGLLTIAVSALTIFGGTLFSSGKEAEETKDKVVDLTKALDDYIAAVKRANDINKLPGTFQFGPSEAELNRELELLKARGASAAEIAAQEQKISKAKETQLRLIESQLQQARNRIIARAEGQDISGLARLPEPIQQLVDANDRLAIENQLAAVTNEIKNVENDRKVIIAERQTQLRDEEKKLREIRDRIKEIAQETFKIDDLTKFTEGIADEITKNVNPLEKVADILDKNIGGQTPGFIQGQPSGRTDLKTPQELAEEAKQRKDDEKRKEDAAQRDKQIIDDSLSYAYNTTIQTLQSIYDAQLFYLDKEIALRRERVDQAVLLAEKGNTDILAAEQDRLRKTEEERERVAERQLQLNALLQASSAAIAATQAIQVVTNAGATGDPYSTAARIAAAVAALAAGFAFVTSLTQAFKFADGVIDLNGPGTERSDSIPARLSKGESVMTAAETKEFRPYLEAMREGTFYNMIANTAQPVFVQGNNYGKLEKKLDGVIAAVEGIHISANQRMDKNGLSQLIESTTRQQTNRWR